MPENKTERFVFAAMTVVITVHAYVFYSLYVVNGQTLIDAAGGNGVLDSINRLGGVYMLGGNRPIWFVVLTEFILALTLEMLLGSPSSFRLASKVFDPCSAHPVIFETAVICATVGIMCPAMSFIAAFLYYPYYTGFDLITLIANWLRLVCLNFPFAFFTQLFFIQPFVRTMFRTLFRRNKNTSPAVQS